MRIITEKDEMRRFSRGQRAEGKRVAFVPTMGYLHEGHLSLVRAARERADVVVTSIYINPTQFAAHEDFDVYPRLLDTDRKKLQDLGCDVCYEPPSLYVQGTPGAGDNSVVVGAEEHMPGAHETFIQVEQLQRPLCGHSRPHFFRGVATIVAKLFNIVQPNIAVFGKKDYQQWRIIRRMVRDLDFEVEVLGMPISREPDGLAMSSRNARLTAASRSQAAAIPQALSWAAEQVREHSVPSADELTAEVARRIRESGGQVDYVSLVDREELRSVAQVHPGMCLLAVAVFFPANDRGTVRLLDNVEL